MRRLLAIGACTALLLAGCKRQSEPSAPVTFTNAARYLDTSGTNTTPAPRHDLSLTPSTRHYLASLGFSYGVQAERGRWTGDTNSLAFTSERLRAAVDGLGRDDHAPWGPRPRAVVREDANGVDRAPEDDRLASSSIAPPAPGREDASDVDRVSEDSAPQPAQDGQPLVTESVSPAATPPPRAVKQLSFFTDGGSEWVSATLNTPEGREPSISDFTVESYYEPSITHADGRWLIRFKEAVAQEDAVPGREDASDVERIPK